MNIILIVILMEWILRKIVIGWVDSLLIKLYQNKSG